MSLQPTQAPQLRLEGVGLATSVGGSQYSQYLLKDISFEVFQGDFVTLVGPSGAGKTSLLRLLNRLNDLTQGSIYFEGQEIRQIPVLQLRQQVMLVLQESKLLGMPVQEALAYPLLLRGMMKQAIQQRIGAWMERLHIPLEWLDRTELQLSVGQRQLVAIARALVIQPKILLLDEPTSSLDTGRGAHVLKVLNELAQAGQITILMANHQLELAKQACTRVLYLQQGALIQDVAADQVNWTNLKETLVQAEAQEAQEWA